MEIAEILFLALVGLALGSFLNVTIDRLPRGESLIRPPSRCDACHHRLGLLDLVPIVSYVWLLGRCRYCDYRIPYRSPLVEAVTAVGCAFIGYQYGLTPVSAVLVLYLTTIIHLILVELEHSLILNSVIVTALVIVLATLPFSPLGHNLGLGETYLHSLAGAGAGIGIMLLIYPLSKGRIGAGKVKLAALLGAMLGFPHIIAGLAVGLVGVGLLAAALLVLKSRGHSDAIPLGPMLLGGAASVLVTGTGIYNWYLWLF